MKKTHYILYVLVLITSVQSCDDPIDFRNGSESEKIVIESVISPNSEFNSVKLSTSIVVNSEVQNLESPNDAEVVITDDESGLEFLFRYDDSQCYSYSNLEVEPGKRYNFSGSLLEDSDIVDVFATTKVPFATEIEEITQLQVDTIINIEDNTLYSLRFQYSIVFADPVSYPAFYKLIPSIKDFGIDTNGEHYLKSTDIFNFDDFEFNVGANATHDIEHREGLLINQSKLDGNNIVLSFETEDTLVLGEDIVPRVFFTLQTVEEDFYHYFLSSSRQIRSARTGSPQPITSYSNVTNGHGVFTSFSEVLDSVSVN